MDGASNGKKRRSKPIKTKLTDYKALTSGLDLLPGDRPDAARDISRVIIKLKHALTSEQEGGEKAQAMLLDLMEWAYLHTRAHQAAFDLYVLFLGGHLRPSDEPVKLLTAAIERGVARAQKKGKNPTLRFTKPKPKRHPAPVVKKALAD